MTKFESIGVSLQQDAPSPEAATRRFRYSCSCCCSRGLRIPCEQCAIKAAHALTLGAFEVLRGGVGA